MTAVCWYTPAVAPGCSTHHNLNIYVSVEQQRGR